MPQPDADRLERSIKALSLALSGLLLGGLAWLVLHAGAATDGRAERYLVASGPLRHGSVLSASHRGPGGTWTAWAACYASRQALSLRVPGRYEAVGAAGLSGAARRVRRAFAASPLEASSGDDLARAMAVWPRGQVWLDRRAGVLIALDASARSACLLVSNTVSLP